MAFTAKDLERALGDPNVKQFLDVISLAEGTDKNGYATAFGGGQIADLSDHPRQLHDFTQTDGKPNKTSAAGRYQFLQGTWDDVAGKLGLTDFSPQSQDIAAVELLRRNGALPALMTGDFDTAVKRSGSTWASLPSSPYAQPKRDSNFIARALDKSAQALLPSAQAGTLPKVDFSKMSDDDLLAGLKPKTPTAVDYSKMSDDDLLAGLAPRKAEPNSVSDNPLVAAAAGAGAGLGQVVLGAQDYLGQGLQAVGADQVGDWLVNDANQGKAKLKDELQPFKDQSPISSTVGEIGGNIVGINPALRAVGGVVKGVAGMGALPGILNPVGSAIGSAGLRSAGVGGASGLAAKTAGGAIAGGIGAGLVDPEAAGTGALIGGVLPGALTGLSKIGDAAAAVLRGPGAPDVVRQSANAARGAGYVVPPTQVKPSLVNRILEGTAGKLSTAQNASARNQTTTDALARKALGVADDTALTPDVLQRVRTDAGKAYEALRSIGTVAADDTYNGALSKIEATYKGAARSFPGMSDNGVGTMVESLRVPSFDAGDAVDAISLLRDTADSAFRGGNNALGRAAKQAAVAVEDAVERSILAGGDDAVMRRFKNARKLIAQTYSIQKAANPATGTVDARKLAGELKRGKPLSDELKQIAEFASAFPKAAQATEGMGSLPGFSPADVFAGVVGAAATQNPAAMLSIFARPMARAATLAKPVQNRLSAASADTKASPLSASTLNLLFEQGYRGAPLLSTSR